MEEFSPAMNSALKGIWIAVAGGLSRYEAEVEVAKRTRYTSGELHKAFELRYKLVPRESLSNFKMAAGNEKLYPAVVDSGYVKSWVGIGWITERKANPNKDSHLWLAYE